MFRFACPNCNAVLQAPPIKAGEKGECPKCGQRILIPNPVKPAAGNKTVLGSLLPESKSQSSTLAHTPVPGWLDDVAKVEEKHSSVDVRSSPPVLEPLEIPDTKAAASAPQSAFTRLLGSWNKWSWQKAGCLVIVVSLLSPVSGLIVALTLMAIFLTLKVEEALWSDFGLLKVGGGLLAGIGFLLLCYFSLIYDTTVPVNSYNYFGERVHNVGLMQDRLIGIIIGGGAFVVGLALVVVGLFFSLGRRGK